MLSRRERLLVVLYLALIFAFVRVLLVGPRAYAQMVVEVTGPIFSNPALFGGSSPPPPPAFTLVRSIQFAGAVSKLPVCVGDAHCVALCYVDVSSTWNCFDNTGALMSGMVQGSSPSPGLRKTFALAPDGGWFQALDYIDDSSNSGAIPHISNAAIRATFGGSHTVIASGYGPGVGGAGGGGWWAMINDGTNAFQMRGATSQFQCLENPGGIVDAASANCKGGWCVNSCRNSAGTIKVRTAGVNSAGVAGATTGAITGSNAFYFGGGTGGCCTPGGGLAGPLAFMAIYSESKTDAWMIQTEKDWWAVSDVQSGGLGGIGSIANSVGRDDIADSGMVQVFLAGAYVNDPVLGVRAWNTMQNFFAADPLAAATWVDVGSPTVTSNTAPGPFYYWKHTNEADLIATSNASGLDGKESLPVSTQADGGFGSGPINCTAVLAAGTSGTTTDKAQFFIHTDGTFDAGTQTCNVSGLTSTFARVPAGLGCWAWIDNATFAKCQLRVGNTIGQTGSILVSQAQVSNTLFPESLLTDNLSRGADWLELDGGDIPVGNVKGKVEAEFVVDFDQSQLTRGHADRSPAAYIFDAYNVGSSHDTLVWAANGMVQSDGGYEPSLDGLMYGPNGTLYAGTLNNKFDNVHPIFLNAATKYVVSYEWRPSGTLDDGGVGCKGVLRLDPAANTTLGLPGGCDSQTGSGCALTVIAQNTGAPGECIGMSEIVDIGTRIGGSSTTSMWEQQYRVYQ